MKNLKLFFEGKKKRILLNFKKEMFGFAKKREFEKANEIKKRIFALTHINDVALIKEENLDAAHKYSDKKVLGSPVRHSPGRPDHSENSFSASRNFRIEAYDVAHMSGKNMVGVMTVIENGELAKNEYKKL